MQNAKCKVQCKIQCGANAVSGLSNVIWVNCGKNASSVDDTSPAADALCSQSNDDCNSRISLHSDEGRGKKEERTFCWTKPVVSIFVRIK